MADSIDKIYLLDNGTLLSRPKYIDLGLESYGLSNTFFGAPFEFHPKMLVQAIGLTPNTSYEFLMQEYTARNGGDTSTSYPNNLEDYTYFFDSTINNGYKTDLMSDGGGVINEIIQFTPSVWVKPFLRQDWIFKYPNEPLRWGEFSTGDPDPNQWMQGLTSDCQIQQIDAGGIIGIRDCVVLPTEIKYTYRLKSASEERIKEITAYYNLATAVDTTETTTLFARQNDLFTMDVFFDGIPETFSPSNLNASVQRATIPYNNTTEREVVHLDYRIKSTD